MLRAWRIAKQRHAQDAFSGEGARLYGGRWNSPGRAAVYVSETRALATLEILAGLRTPSVVPAYVLIPVEIEEDLVIQLAAAKLPEGWKDSPPGDTTQRLGDEWLDGGESVALRVPSAVVPSEFNYVLNPVHPDFGRLRVGKQETLYLDPRILPR